MTPELKAELGRIGRQATMLPVEDRDAFVQEQVTLLTNRLYPSVSATTIVESEGPTANQPYRWEVTVDVKVKLLPMEAAV